MTLPDHIWPVVLVGILDQDGSHVEPKLGSDGTGSAADLHYLPSATFLGVIVGCFYEHERSELKLVTVGTLHEVTKALRTATRRHRTAGDKAGMDQRET